MVLFYSQATGSATSDNGVPIIWNPSSIFGATNDWQRRRGNGQIMINEYNMLTL